MSGQGNVRKLVRRLEEQGAVVERGTDHWKIKREGQLVAILPTHGAREYGPMTLKVRSALRRAGFEL